MNEAQISQEIQSMMVSFTYSQNEKPDSDVLLEMNKWKSKLSPLLILIFFIIIPHVIDKIYNTRYSLEIIKMPKFWMICLS